MTRDELIAALEAAEGPSRKLDAEIERLRLPPAEMDRFAACVTGWVVANDASGEEFMSDSHTDSVDAALMLVPEGWHVHSLRQDYGRWTACLHRAFGSHTADNAVWQKGHHWPPEYMVNGEALTPAAALCAAALRADTREDTP